MAFFGTSNTIILPFPPRRRKRSSDGTPEVVETVEEQIVRHLTERRVNELNQSLAETKEEYLALKKEIELIERGEMDNRLPEVWQEVQAELAVKDAAEGRKKPGAANKRSPAGKAQEPTKVKGQKTSPSGGKRATVDSKKPKRAAEEREIKKEVGRKGPSREGKGEEKEEEKDMEVSPDRTQSSLSAVVTPEGVKTPIDIKTEPIFHPLTSVSGSLISDESPLPKPITIPKEEVFGESIIGTAVALQAATPTSSESPIPQFAADIHIIVQQPNIAVVNIPPPLSTSTPALHAHVPQPSAATPTTSQTRQSASSPSLVTLRDVSAEGVTPPTTFSGVSVTPTPAAVPPRGMSAAKPGDIGRLVPPDRSAYLEIVRKLAAATTSLTRSQGQLVAASPSMTPSGNGTTRTQPQVVLGGVAKGQVHLPPPTPPLLPTTSPSQAPQSSEGQTLPPVSEAQSVSRVPLTSVVLPPPPLTHTVTATVLASTTPVPQPFSCSALPLAHTPVAQAVASSAESKARYD